ncbi:helicase-related protein [Paucisalibacillus globulus]|uniref:helicase-related protein n=1 Tax=Paucisalibacillus globulus TaxID=351095 RepID=UPI00248110C8|nr:helicase-related protein [Paucisalibacillus globulus]
MKEKKIPKSLLEWLVERKNKKRQLLIFVPSIKLAEEFKTNLQKDPTAHLGNIVSVHSEDEQRVEKINQFRKKEINVLVTTTILERGVTFPSVDVVVLDAGHAVFDEAALVQIAGRAGRSADDPTGEVIFLHDGKTEAMIRATQSIRIMNRRGGF